MGRDETLKAVREKYPQYADMGDDALGSALAAKYPQYADLAPKTAAKDPYEGSPITGAIADTLGLTDRPGAVPLTGRPGFKTPLGVLVKPEGTLEHLASAAITAPAIYGGGALAGALTKGAPALVRAAAPVAGRMIGSGAVGAGEAELRGDSALYGFLLDAVVSGLTEGAVSGVSALPKVGLKALGAPARGFKWATEAPEKALDAIASRLPAGKWFNVPSLSGTPLTVKDAVKKLATKEGLEYQQARAEIANEMNRLDMQKLTGPKPLAGGVFKKGTEAERYRSPNLGRAKVAETVRGAINTPEARAAADALVTTEPEMAMGAAMQVPGFGAIARAAMPHVMVP